MYSQYIGFPGDFRTKKRFVSPSFFSDMNNVVFDSFKVIHHSHITGEIYGYAYNFCNKKVKELTENSGQYISCVFHNGFRFDMTFLTIGLSLWKTQYVSLEFSGLTTFTLLHSWSWRKINWLCIDANEKKSICGIFLDYLAFTHP